VTFEEVVEKCGEHAFFFFWQFTQEKPDEFDWKSTGFYKWLVNSHAVCLPDACQDDVLSLAGCL
jgi:hypothetical protein